MGETLRRAASKDEPDHQQQQQHPSEHGQLDAAFVSLNAPPPSNSTLSSNHRLVGKQQQHQHRHAAVAVGNNKCAIVLAGQFLSFLLAGAGAAQATLHLECHLTAPAFTVGLFYLALAVGCLVPLYGKQRRQQRQRQLLANKNQQQQQHPAAAAAAAAVMLHHPSSTRSSPSAAYHRASTNQSDEDDRGGDEIIRHTTTTTTTTTMMNHTTTTTIAASTDYVDEEVWQQQSLSNSSSSSSNNHSNLNHRDGDHTFLCFRLHAPWFAYAFMAVLDVYANCATVLAFRYTTITSVTLLDAAAIPTAMLLSSCGGVLRRRYAAPHLLGVALCLTGIAVNVLQDLEPEGDDDDGESDSNSNNNKEYPHKIVGDLLALLGGVLFGANNVLGEVAVKHCRDPDEYIGMQSLFAVAICAVQTAWTERDAVAAFVGSGSKSETCSLAAARWLIAAFVVSNVLGYMGGARFLLHSEAAFFNLSLLTGDFWSVAFQIVAQQIMPAASFFCAVVLTVSGVLVYELAAPAPDRKQPTSLEADAGAGGIMLVASKDGDDDDENNLAIELAPATTTMNGDIRHHNGVGGAKDGPGTTTRTPMEVI